MCITETWLKGYITDAQVAIENYDVIRSDRSLRDRGGVLMYLHDSLLVSNVLRHDDGVCEAVIASIDTLKTVVACIYRPPDAGTASFKKMMLKVQEYLSYVNPEYDKILTGDFNLPNINWDTWSVANNLGKETTACANCLLEFIDCNFLTQVVSIPTRGRAILDLVMTSNENVLSEVTVSETPLSDHNIIETSLIYDARTKIQQRKVKTFGPLTFNALNIHGMDTSHLDGLLDDIDWDELYNYCADCYDSEEDCISAYAELVQLTVLQLTLEHATEKKPSTNHKPSRPRRILYRKRRKLNARLNCLKVHYPNSPKVSKLNTELNLLEIQIRDAIEDELNTKEKKAVTNIKECPRYFFSYAKRFAKTKSNIGPLRDNSGNLKHKPEEMANILQSQYSSVFSDPNSPDIDLAATHTEKNNTSSITDIEVTPKLMMEAMSELNANSSAPDCEIPAKILKNCRMSLCKPLTILWQKSSIAGIIPTQFKKQFIAPIFKKGNKTDPANYRPISLTSHVIKIFERVIRNQLVNFLETNKLISAKQHGFRRGRSCLTQLLSHVDNILENYTNGIETDVIYLDFAKAFDKVDHQILLHKLSLYGIQGSLLNWLSAFLLNRQQVVVVDGELSTPAPVTSGVPQGTVLGPILFILYINDIENVLSESRSSSFADDTRMSKAISCVQDTEVLQKDLNAVIKWSKRNNMKLHEDKFELLCYQTNGPKLLQELPFADQYYQYMTPAGHIMTQKSTVKDLGVLLSSDLSWSQHITTMIASARKVCSWVLSVFRDRSKPTMLLLYKSLIRCKLEYCCPVWDPTQIGNIQNIEDIQRNFTAKIICCKDMDYWTRLRVLNLQSLQRRRERYSIIHMWKLLNNAAPNDLNVKFIDQERKGMRVRLPALVKGATCAAQTARDNSFSLRAAKLWNILPANVTRITKFETFKTELGNFIAQFPDRPPATGYSCVNTNSILDWSGTRWTAKAC